MKLKLITIFAILGVLLSACATPAPTPAQPKSILDTLGPKFTVAYIEADTYYQDIVQQEVGLTEAQQAWEEKYSTMMASAADQQSIIASCWSNSEKAINDSVSLVFGQDANGNPLSSNDQNSAFIKALGTGTGFYAGNIQLCQQAALDFMSAQRAARDATFNLRLVVISRFNTLNLSKVKNLKIATVLNFYDQYGPSIAKAIQNGESAAINAIAAQNTLEPLPLDFIGFPTAALQAQSKSKAICDGNQQYFDGTLPTPGGENPLLYVAQWDEVNHNCTLQRMAAYRYIAKIFLTAQTAVRMDCGVDAGINEVVGPDCQVETMTPPAP